MPLSAENSPLLGIQFVDNRHKPKETKQRRPKQDHEFHVQTSEHRRNFIWALFLSTVCLVAVYVLKNAPTLPQRSGTSASKRADTNYPFSSFRLSKQDGINAMEKSANPLARDVMASIEENAKPNHSHPKVSPYTKVQTLSFQIYTGGAPAYLTDELTGSTKHNHECKGLNSYGLPEDSNTLQCYLGLEDTALDVQRRLGIMRDAVDRAYDVSDQDESTLKIFLAPEFFFRGKDGAFAFANEEQVDSTGECSDICHILKGLEDIAAHKRFENWLFLFGTVIGSETLPTEDAYDFQFYNFAPLYRGFDPATSKRIGKNFIVPKRYVSNIDFLTPLRHLTNKSIAMELLDEQDPSVAGTLMNPHSVGHKRYDNEMWAKYKDELSSLGYTMIEYGWFYMDGIAFSVEICLDHLVHRALMTYMADVVTGSKTLVPSSANDSVEWVGIPRNQAQISLVSSAGMDVTVSSLALANGGHIFLQDGMEGDVSPHSTYGEDECQVSDFVSVLFALNCDFDTICNNLYYTATNI